MTMTTEERKAASKAANARYRKTPKYRERRDAYRQSVSGKAVQEAASARYLASAKGVAYRSAYNRSETAKQAKARYSAERKQRFKDWLRSLKRTGCLDCGRFKRQPDRLEFHHRDPSTKLMNVPIMSSYSRERVMSEINKCDVLCGDCHRKRHSR